MACCTLGTLLIATCALGKGLRCAGGDLQLPSAKALARQLLLFKASLVSLDLRGTCCRGSEYLNDGRSALLQTVNSSGLAD